MLSRTDPTSESQSGDDRPVSFLSCAHEDIDVARSVAGFLWAKGRDVFFAEEDSSSANFVHAINEMLARAVCIIAVATAPEHLKKPWPTYEIESFQGLILSRRKHDDAFIAPFIAFKPSELDLPLSNYRAIQLNPKDLARGLEQLDHYLLRFLGPTPGHDAVDQ